MYYINIFRPCKTADYVVWYDFYYNLNKDSLKK